MFRSRRFMIRKCPLHVESVCFFTLSAVDAYQTHSKHQPHKSKAIKTFSLLLSSLAMRSRRSPAEERERQTINILRRIRSNEMHYCLLRRICEGIVKKLCFVMEILGFETKGKTFFYDVKSFRRERERKRCP